MKQPRDSYPQAFVPEHLTKLTIDMLPLDIPFYISPGERDDYEPPAVYVDHDKRLRMSRSVAVDSADSLTNGVPFGLVGVMRSTHIDEETNTVKEVYVADLRMVDAYSLVSSDDINTMMLDQEEYMQYVAELERSIVFDGLIVADSDDMDNKDLPRGAFYGSEAVHSQLKVLSKRSKHLVRHALKTMATREDAQKTKEKKKQDDKQKEIQD